MSALWSRYGLGRTPFFQEPLDLDVPTADLNRLFVGRTTDRVAVLDQLTYDEQTRVVLVGDPGVGKTTLMNRVLADLRAGTADRPEWLVPELGPINLPGASSLADFSIEVLRQLLDLRRQHHAAGANGGVARAARGVRAVGRRTRQAVVPGTGIWDVVTRTVDGLTTYSPQVAGFGVSTQVTPASVSAGQWTPIVRAALEALVVETGRDLVIAVNNAENLARPMVDRARDVLIDARQMLMVPRVHWLFVGTPDFFQQVIAPERRLAGIMQHAVVLDPLSPADVAEVLAVRYEVLRVPGRELIPPVDLASAAELAGLFVGDLRELLRSLEAAVLALAHRGPITMGTDIAMPLIAVQQRELLADRLQSAAWKHLVRVVLGAGPGSDAGNGILRRFREADAVRRLSPMRQPTVHAHKQNWLSHGFVRADGRTGASEWLVVTGGALLAMLHDALDDGYRASDLLGGRDLGPNAKSRADET